MPAPFQDKPGADPDKISAGVETVARWDRSAGDALTVYRSSTAMKVLGPMSDIADQWPLFGLCAFVTVAGLYRKDRGLAVTGGEMALAMLTATTLKNIVKDRIDRTRPSVIADGGSYVFQRGDHDVTELDSFPSGHTAGAVAVARVVARRHPRQGGVALVTACAVAATQMPRGKHYPSDLLAGALVGLLAEQVSSELWTLARKVR